MFVLIDGHQAGIMTVSKPIKGSTTDAINKLHNKGIQVVMLTCNNRVSADAVAKTLDIDAVFIKVLPGEKATEGKRLQYRGIIWSYG